MLRTEIKTIPHHTHRYPTVGDYYYEDGHTKILVSDMKNEKYEFLVSIHEQVEEFLTKIRGITEDTITAFDKAFEECRKQGDYSEPGDSPLSPYQREHQFATFVEKLVAIQLGVKWEDYEQAIINLDEPSNTGC